MQTEMLVSDECEAAPTVALPSMRRNFCWTFVGNTIYAACQWGLLVVIAKIGTTVMVGRFGIALALTAPVIMFSNLQLATIQATDAKRQFLFGDYLGLRMLTTLCALIAIPAITWCSGYHGETALVVLAVGLAKAFEAGGDVVYGLFTQREELHYVAKSMMARGVLSLMAVYFGLRLTHSVLSGAVALACVNALVLLVYDLRNGTSVLRRWSEDSTRCFAWFPRPRWQWPKLTTMALMALPMGVVALMSSLNTNIPRYFIERCLGERQLGIFVAMAYIQVAGTIVVRALGQSVCSRMASHYAEMRMTAYRNIMLKLLGAGLVISVAGVAIAWKAGPRLLSILYRPEYMAYSDTFVWLMAGSAGVYLAMFLGYGLTAARRLNVQTWLMVIASVTTMILCFPLVPRYGLNGAAIALLVGNFVWVLGSLLVLASVLRTGKRGSSPILEIPDES